MQSNFLYKSIYPFMTILREYYCICFQFIMWTSLTVLSGGKFSIHFHNCSKCTSKLQYYYYSTCLFLFFSPLSLSLLIPVASEHFFSGICVLHLNLLRTVALEMEHDANPMRTCFNWIALECKYYTQSIRISLFVCVCVCVWGHWNGTANYFNLR